MQNYNFVSYITMINYKSRFLYNKHQLKADISEFIPVIMGTSALINIF